MADDIGQFSFKGMRNLNWKQASTTCGWVVIMFFQACGLGLAFTLASFMLPPHSLADRRYLSVSHKLKSEKGVFFPLKRQCTQQRILLEKCVLFLIRIHCLASGAINNLSVSLCDE